MKSLLLTLLAGLANAVSAPAAEPAPRPNILLIVSEDNGPELGCYGDPFARTPNLDHLAAQGVRFERAFVTQAGCSQSRASILTGLYPHQHGQIGLATWGFRLSRDDTPNLVRTLKDAGYRTGIIGKLHIAPESVFPFDFRAIESGNFARKNLRAYATQAKAFIEESDRPFFLIVNYPEAHSPWLRQVEELPADPLAGNEVKAMPYMGIDPPGLRETVADYYNSIARLDALVGDLLEVLQKSGRADDTLVVYTSDHGADMLRGKRTCYEGGLRIPLLLRWPGRIEPQVRGELVSTTDLVPTVLNAAGLPAFPGLPGRALQPLLTADETPWREHVFAEYHLHSAANFFPQRAVRTDRYKLIENLLPDRKHPDFDTTLRKLSKEAAPEGAGRGPDLEAALAAAPPDVAAAYERMRRPPRFELYDLQDDPHEFRNLAGSPEHADTLAELSKTLTTWRRATQDPLLDPDILQRLAAEVGAVRSKSDGRRTDWRYPEYFRGEAPAGGEAASGNDEDDAAAIASTDHAPFLEKSELFRELSDGFTLYRIPGIVVTARGTVLAYCEARKFTGADRGEIEIHLRRSTDGGRTFSPAVQVAHFGPRLPRNPHMPEEKKKKDMGGPDEQTVNNPVAIAARDGTVHLLYCVEYMRVFHVRSDDDGETWSQPAEITEVFDRFRPELDWQAVAIGPGHGAELTGGRLVAPFWMATYEPGAPLRKAVGTVFSDDGGRTWQRGDVAVRDVGEPNIAPLPEGGAILTARNNHPQRRRLLTRSPDGATGWSGAEYAEELLESGCMAGIVAHPGTPSVPGPLLLFSNPQTVEKEGAARRDVTVHLSRDQGKTWPVSRTLQRGPSAYSDLAVLPDGTVLCFYESGTDEPVVKRPRDWAYAHLTLARFNLPWLLENVDSPNDR